MEVWTTSAGNRDDNLTYASARERMAADGKPVLLVFGTGWGLAARVEADSDARIEPIQASSDTGFNHLSVRAACAITLDRILGRR